MGFRPSVLGPLAFAGLLATALRAQTAAIDLTFANPSNRLQDTGSSGITFSLSGGALSFGAGEGTTTAATFDGTNKLTATSSPITSAFTIAFWMKTTTAGTGTPGVNDWYAGSGLVDGEMLTATQDWGVTLLGNKVALGIGGPDLTIVSTSSVTDGSWVYVTGTWDGSGHTSTLYLDGSQQAQSTAAPGQDRITNNPFEIGKDPTTGGFYNGALSDIQVYTTAFTPAEVQSNYNLTAVPEPSTYALLAGSAALGYAAWRRRPVRV
jgi:hypothetical protein